MSKAPRYLLDVNVLVALSTRSHIHHTVVKGWFYATPRLQWDICALTEAGFIRNATAPRSGQITMSEASEVLKHLAQHPGYRYLPIDADWQTLSSPFFTRFVRHQTGYRCAPARSGRAKQLVLVTMDKAILHLAGTEHSKHVLLLKGE